MRFERPSASGHYIEVSYKPLDNGTILSIHRDITELKEREESLAAAKEAAEAARADAERTRQIMQTVLDNMKEGVQLFDKNLRVEFVNRQLMEFHDLPPEIGRPGSTGYDILRFMAERGDYGPDVDVEKIVAERAAIILDPAGRRHQRRTANGRLVEFTFIPLAEGRVLAVGHDVTEVQERTAETERTRMIMQTAFDNMDDGVALLDKDFRLQFVNRERVKSVQLPAEMVLSRRGCGGADPLPGAARRFRPGRQRRRRSSARSKRRWRGCSIRTARATSGSEGDRTIEYNFKPISDGGLLAVFRDITELKDREQALAAAKEDVERIREVMQTVLDNMNDGVDPDRQGFLLPLRQQPVQGKAQASGLGSRRAGYPIEDLIRFQAARGDFGPVDDVERMVGERRADDADAGRRALRPQDRQRPPRRVRLHAIWPTAACSACTATSPSSRIARRRWPRPRRRPRPRARRRRPRPRPSPPSSPP